MGDACWAWGTNDPNAPSYIVQRGMFINNRRGTFADCADGTSNTVAVSECVTPERDRGTETRTNVILHTAMWVSTATAHGYPGRCVTAYPVNVTEFSTIPGFNPWRGTLFTAGWNKCNGFTTTTPPNSAMCLYDRTWGALPPGSYHPGGVNVAFFDGTVRFISDLINCPLTPNAVKDGVSPFGVWGALGSPDGGETVTAPN